MKLAGQKRNAVPKKLFKIGDMIDCVITEIDKDKEDAFHKLTLENPTVRIKIQLTEIDETVLNINEYALYVKINDYDIDGFHANDLSYVNKPEDELKKFKKGDQIKVKVLEIKKKNKKLELV